MTSKSALQTFILISAHSYWC